MLWLSKPISLSFRPINLPLMDLQHLFNSSNFNPFGLNAFVNAFEYLIPFLLWYTLRSICINYDNCNVYASIRCVCGSLCLWDFDGFWVNVTFGLKIDFRLWLLLDFFSYYFCIFPTYLIRLGFMLFMLCRASTSDGLKGGRQRCQQNCLIDKTTLAGGEWNEWHEPLDKIHFQWFFFIECGCGKRFSLQVFSWWIDRR